MRDGVWASGRNKKEVEMGRTAKQKTPEQEKLAADVGRVMTELMKAHHDPTCSTHNRWVWVNKGIKPKLAQGQTVGDLLSQIEAATAMNGGVVDGLCYWQVFPPMPIKEVRAKRRQRIVERLEDEHAALKEHTGKLYPRTDPPPEQLSQLQRIIRKLERHIGKVHGVSRAISDLRSLAQRFRAGQVADLDGEATDLVGRCGMKPDMVSWIVRAIREEKERVGVGEYGRMGGEDMNRKGGKD